MTSVVFEEIRTALNLSEKKVASEAALASAIATGLPVAVVQHLIDLGMPEEEIYRFIPRRTLQRRVKAKALLTPEESERIERVAAVFGVATRVFGNAEQALHWLLRPKHQFDNRRPIDLIHSYTGARMVEERLLQGYFGNVG